MIRQIVAVIEWDDESPARLTPDNVKQAIDQGLAPLFDIDEGTDNASWNYFKSARDADTEERRQA